MSGLVLFARRLAPLCLGAALFIGCNTTLTLDNENLQQSIAQGLQDQAGVTATVTCPDDRPLLQGDTFVCQAVTSDGQTLQITVTQTDNNSNVHWEVTGAS